MHPGQPSDPSTFGLLCLPACCRHVWGRLEREEESRRGREAGKSEGGGREDVGGGGGRRGHMGLALCRCPVLALQHKHNSG